MVTVRFRFGKGDPVYTARLTGDPPIPRKGEYIALAFADGPVRAKVTKVEYRLNYSGIDANFTEALQGTPMHVDITAHLLPKEDAPDG